MNNPEQEEVKYLAMFLLEEKDYSEFMYYYSIKAYLSSIDIINKYMSYIELNLLDVENSEGLLIQYHKAKRLLDIVTDLTIVNEGKIKIRNVVGKTSRNRIEA